MSRPLVITDCDEVLLHMIVHFRDWLDEAHDIDFRLEGRDFSDAMRRRGSDAPIAQEEMWGLLNSFFDSEMDRQTAIAGAVEAIGALQEEADVVVLTNLADHRQQDRVRQLARHGLHLPVFTNLGPKGPALRAILDEYRPSKAFFVDDLSHHHASAAEQAPEITRLHFVGEPAVAAHVPCAFTGGHAHARIDNWHEALQWLRERLHEEKA